MVINNIFGEKKDFHIKEKIYSTLDKQHICVNTQLKALKKQLKLNVCILKSNSIDRYAITCNIIAYHLVQFDPFG